MGKVSVPNIAGLDKMKPAMRKQTIATEITYAKIDVCLRVMGLTTNNGETCKGGDDPIVKTRKLPADIKKIEVIF